MELTPTTGLGAGPQLGGFHSTVLRSPPVQTTMTFSPADWGTRLKLMDGYFDADNRDIREDRVRVLAPHAERIALVTTITLCPDGANFRILDAQHRLKAALVNRGLTLTWRVLLLDPYPEAIPELIRNLQESRGQTIGDTLKTYRKSSIWPGLISTSESVYSPTYSSGSACLTWSSVVRGYCHGIEMIRLGRVTSGTSIDAGQLLNAWLSATPEEVCRMRDILDWKSKQSRSVAGNTYEYRDTRRAVQLQAGTQQRPAGAFPPTALYGELPTTGTEPSDVVWEDRSGMRKWEEENPLQENSRRGPF